MMLKKVLIIPVVLCLMAGCLPRPQPRTGDFNAIVKDILTEQPIPGVSINIGGQSKETDLKGQFSLADLTPGDYQIRLSRQWYESKDVTYKHLGKPEPVTFYLRPISLPGRIYYSYEEGKDREIYELLLESRTVRKVLASQDSDETNPAWSTSGRFAVESTADKVSKVKVYDLGRGNTPILIRDGEHPSLDKEGKYVVFKSKGKIVKYDIDSNQEIESYDQAGWNPVLSPDGTRVAYVSGDYDKLYIYSSKYDFKEFSSNGFKFNNPCWSPDGSMLAFEAYENSEGKRAIYYIIVDSLDLGMTQITVPLGDKEQHKHPTWGEDNIIYFSGNIIYSSRSDIYAVGLDQGFKWVMVSKGSGDKLYPCWGK